ncbi:hypothetical protein S7711_10671 [Stachybotrys chartarum IBT 7711]|uniref:Uncharacterized protein n=1 Tax=Stachybotrys chartarum (strain CBS 109288 / IBT 7711) TaxID=1280523 RepID=A0A084B8E1_STACB|nr:hypothetical protein S7711_10671 [Stachybotrys chartarum IBT 7711]KFA55400.1 hypothetical protein S40293_10987 [Stachybotrys chartarum IBT 40293]
MSLHHIFDHLASPSSLAQPPQCSSHQQQLWQISSASAGTQDPALPSAAALAWPVTRHIGHRPLDDHMVSEAPRQTTAPVWLDGVAVVARYFGCGGETATRGGARRGFGWASSVRGLRGNEDREVGGAARCVEEWVFAAAVRG